jgi:two-component system, OmpR family, response regulator
MRHPGEVLTRRRILEHVWDYDESSNVVDVYTDELGRIFHRFYLIDSAGARTVGGSGMRLRSARRSCTPTAEGSGPTAARAG